jgi:hypothetical protein
MKNMEAKFDYKIEVLNSNYKLLKDELKVLKSESNGISYPNSDTWFSQPHQSSKSNSFNGSMHRVKSTNPILTMRMIGKETNELIKSKIILIFITYMMRKRKSTLHRCTCINGLVIGSYDVNPNLKD